jgi:hypothetical protein
MSPIAVVVKNRFMMSLLGSLITGVALSFARRGEAGEAFCRLLEQRSRPIVPKNSHRSASSANDEIALCRFARIDQSATAKWRSDGRITH